jgi:hypothetical protein
MSFGVQVLCIVMHVVNMMLHNICRTTGQEKPDPVGQAPVAEQPTNNGPKDGELDSAVSRHAKSRKLIASADAAASTGPGLSKLVHKPVSASQANAAIKGPTVFNKSLNMTASSVMQLGTDAGPQQPRKSSHAKPGVASQNVAQTAVQPKGSGQLACKAHTYTQDRKSESSRTCAVEATAPHEGTMALPSSHAHMQHTRSGPIQSAKVQSGSDSLGAVNPAKVADGVTPAFPEA